MGFTPIEIGQMSVWEYQACCDGYNRHHGGASSSGGGTELTETQLRDMGIEGF